MNPEQSINTQIQIGADRILLPGHFYTKKKRDDKNEENFHSRYFAFCLTQINSKVNVVKNRIKELII